MDPVMQAHGLFSGRDSTAFYIRPPVLEKWLWEHQQKLLPRTMFQVSTDSEDHFQRTTLTPLECHSFDVDQDSDFLRGKKKKPKKTQQQQNHNQNHRFLNRSSLGRIWEVN